MPYVDLCDIYSLPYGNSDFLAIRQSNQIYVDKTSLIAKIAKENSPLFFSRPRRFGKSLLINTLHVLFDKGLKYFNGLDIEKIWNDKIYKVVHLDFSGMARKNPYEFKRVLGDEIIQEFDVRDQVQQFDAAGIREPSAILSEISKKLLPQSVVILIDEYDAPLIHHLDNPDELQELMDILNDFYSIIKQFTGKFRFVFITGITRTSHLSIFSAFNNLIDLSLNVELSDILGFTENDIEKYFYPFLKNSSRHLQLSTDDLLKRIEQYYDGFQFSINARQRLYNPWSILSFFKFFTEGFQNYWFNSGGSSTIIKKYLKISNSFDILDYKKKVVYKSLSDLSLRYEITDIPQEILLFQAGYLTIRKENDSLARLILPNTEVEDSMLRLYLTVNNAEPSIHTSNKIAMLTECIDNKDLRSIVDIFNAILNDCVSSLSNIFKDERSVRDIIFAAIPQKISLQKIKERETLKGRSDLELLTTKTYMVIEFKRTSSQRDEIESLKEAIEQVKKNKYGIGSFSNRTLYRVALVISSEKKQILPEFCCEIDSTRYI